MEKHARHFAIREIIGKTAVASQDELRLALRKKGFRVTQATLSRDMKKLGMSWVSTDQGGRYVLQSAASEVQILRPLVGPQVLGINANESVIVVRTLPGSASVIAEFLDSHNNPDIIGTIAGDNTLLIIPQSRGKMKSLVAFLHEKLIEGQR